MHKATEASADRCAGVRTEADGLVPMSTIVAEILARLAAQRMPGSIPPDGML